MLLADTCRSFLTATSDLPIFTLGFEYTHGLMRQHIPSADDWRKVFAESAWTLHGIHELNIPETVVFRLVPALDEETPGMQERNTDIDIRR